MNIQKLIVLKMLLAYLDFNIAYLYLLIFIYKL